MLFYRYAFISDAFDGCGYGNFVVVADLGGEVNFEMHYHDCEVSLLRRYASSGEESRLAEVEVLHYDGVVDVSHLVNVVEANLDRKGVHGGGDCLNVVVGLSKEVFDYFGYDFVVGCAGEFL